MEHISAAAHYAPISGSRDPGRVERDTLDEERGDRFLREELEALLSSAIISPASPSRRAANASDHSDDDNTFESDTELSVDLKLVREALAAARK